MGPQSYDCGNANPGLTGRKVRHVRSFNGAAVVRLRKFQSFVYIHSGNVASMGPQSYDCGNVNASSVMATTTPGFNGAAVVRLRKCSCRRGPPVGAGALQWGRSRTTAEMQF